MKEEVESPRYTCASGRMVDVVILRRLAGKLQPLQSKLHVHVEKSRAPFTSRVDPYLMASSSLAFKTSEMMERIKGSLWSHRVLHLVHYVTLAFVPFLRALTRSARIHRR